MWNAPEFVKDTDSAEVEIAESDNDSIEASERLASYAEAFGPFQGAKRLKFTDGREVLFVRFEAAYVLVFSRPGGEAGDAPARTQVQLSRESMHAVYLLYWLTAIDDELFERDAQLLDDFIDTETRTRIEQAFLPLAGALDPRGEHEVSDFEH